MDNDGADLHEEVPEDPKRLTRIQLGFEAYYAPRESGHDAAKSHARVWFLDIVQQEAKGVLESLASDVFPTFARSCGQGTPASTLARVIPALTSWMRSWNLDFPWVEETALATLDSWRDVGIRRHRKWCFLGDSVRYPFGPGEVSSHAAADALALERGFRPAPRTDGTNLVALCRYQVLGQSHSQIASSEGTRMARQSVGEALSRAAELLDIEIRPSGKGGRPPKKAGKTPN